MESQEDKLMRESGCNDPEPSEQEIADLEAEAGRPLPTLRDLTSYRIRKLHGQMVADMLAKYNKP